MDDLESFVADMEETTGSQDAGANGFAALVSEFVPLDRRRKRGDSPLAPAEAERWTELREQLEYYLNSASPILVGTRRRMLRVPGQLKVRSSGSGDAVATLHNLSELGAFVESSQRLAPGASLELEIDPGGGEPPLRLSAVVRWERELPNMDGPAGFGVEFENVEDGDHAALERLVESWLLAAQRRVA